MQVPVSPWAFAQPFVDFQAEIRALDPHQQAVVVGKANWQLIESGKATWDDVVTPSRVRDLREVVSRKKLTVAEMKAGGVRDDIARKAYESVHTPAHELKDAQRRELVARLQAKGVTDAQIKKAFAERIAQRVIIKEGPSGPQKFKITPTTPKTPMVPVVPKVPRKKAATAKAPKVVPQPKPETLPVKEPQPAGKPVSNALTLPDTIVGRQQQKLMKIIDAIHGDGNLKVIPVLSQTSPDFVGVFRRNRQGEALEIVVDPLVSDPMLTLAHEIGHFLERTGMTGITFDRDFESDPLLAEWLKAVKSSEAIKKLDNHLTSTKKLNEGLSPGTAIDTKILEYLLSGPEKWARSYSQYIAVRSGDPTMLADVDAGASKPTPEQWEAADFEPIAQAIDSLFAKLGWRK